MSSATLLLPRRFRARIRTAVSNLIEASMERRDAARGRTRGKVAINVSAKTAPWGGGNQFLLQLEAYLRRHGYCVTHRLAPDVTSILLVEPRSLDTTTFGIEEIRRFKLAHPGVRCVHRINECDRRKGTHGVDDMLREANKVADSTVFISQWLRDYFVNQWFDPGRPHQIILNGADPRIFHPDSSTSYEPQGEFRIVTHHWADNWMKGFRTYQQVDRMIANGELEGFVLSVIGRWPAEIRWVSARTYPPAVGEKLAAHLRANHAYITASLWEPGGMHAVEGIQCGLPIVYHEDGGGIVEVAQGCGVSFRDDVKSALLLVRARFHELRDRALATVPSGDEMCNAYEAVLFE